MQAEIIAIGTELLLGHLVNTNVTYVSKCLASLGIDVYYQTTVGDNPMRLSSMLKTALERSDIVITMGGLGPTVDDITKETAAGVLHKKLVLKKRLLADIKEHFRKQHLTMPPNNVSQAYIPHGARTLRNNLGTAPGLIIPLTHGAKTLIALPGPPRELIPILERDVLPYLKKNCSATWIIKSRLLKSTGLPESRVNAKVKDILKLGGPVTVGIYAHIASVDLKITAKAKTEKRADRLIGKVERKIKGRLGGYIFGTDRESLESAVSELLKKNKKSIAIAESCSGGLLSHRLTNVPGSSKYFLLGEIAYTNQAKTAQLKVSRETIKKYGAVSRKVALLMARGIRENTGAHIGIGITGIAGPGGATRVKPVGLVYIALAAKNHTQCKEFHFMGTREEIKFQSSQYALDMIRKHLLIKRGKLRRSIRLPEC